MKNIAKKTGFMLLAVAMLQLPLVSEASAANILKAGQTLGKGQMLQSADGRFALVMQTDGNLVLYKAGVSLWDSDTSGDTYRWTDPITGYTITRYSEQLTLNYGMIRVTDRFSDYTFWKSNTSEWMNRHYGSGNVPAGLIGDTLMVQDDGNVVFSDTIGNPGGQWLPVWATDTYGH